MLRNFITFALLATSAQAVAADDGWTVTSMDAEGPPKMAMTEDGQLEDERWCMPGESVVTRFELVAFEGTATLVPVYVDGDTRFVGTEIDEVRVVDWGDATELHLSHDSYEVSLDTESEALELWVEEGTRLWVEEGTRLWVEEGTRLWVEEGTRFMHHLRWDAGELTGAQPIVEVRGTCMEADPEVRLVEGQVLAEDADGVTRVDGEHLVVEMEGTGLVWTAPVGE